MLSLASGPSWFYLKTSRPRSELPHNNISISARIVLLGESTVGKSSLVLRFVMGQFFENQQPTIGAEFLLQSVCSDDRLVRFEIWDTAGQERYHSLAPMYYKGADAAIVAYDITNKKCASPYIVIALAGNKADLGSQRWVELDEAQTYANDNALLFMETSAKTATNVNDIFLAIAKQLAKSDVDGVAGQEIERVYLHPETHKPPGSCCCRKSS